MVVVVVVRTSIAVGALTVVSAMVGLPSCAGYGIRGRWIGLQSGGVRNSTWWGQRAKAQSIKTECVLPAPV